MEQKFKTVTLNEDNSRKIIIVLSVIIVILMSVIIVIASKKTPSLTVNSNISNTHENTQNNSVKTEESNAQQALRHQITTAPAKTEPPKDNVKTIYLTFDDGPSPYTLEILDILDKYDVKATFFVINTKYNQYMKNIVERGHTIALHSYSHDYKGIYSSEEAYYKDLQAISDVVFEQTGVRTNIIRFPGGGSNTISRKYCPGIMKKLTKGVQEKGYSYFDWNITSGDADGNNLPTEKLIAQCKKVPKYTNTAVVLMHDTKMKRTTVDALPTIIENYKAMGCKFDSIKSSTPPIHHGVNN